MSKKATTSADFVPRSIEDIFALYLSRKLRDVSSIGFYVRLTKLHSMCLLLNALRTTRRRTESERVEPSEFLAVLRDAYPVGLLCMNCSDLLTIAIERRRIAMATFAGLHLDYLQVRELTADQNEAARTTQRVITWQPQPSILLVQAIARRKFGRVACNEAASRISRLEEMSPPYRSVPAALPLSNRARRSVPPLLHLN